MHATISRLFSCSQRQQSRNESTSAISRLDVMSEVDEILNNLPRDEQSRRRVWEWIQAQSDDGSEQESESQAGRSRKDPPDPEQTGEEESQPPAHGASNGQDSGSKGGNLPTRVESPTTANFGDSPLPLGSTAALGGPPRRGRSMSDGSSAALGRSKRKGRSALGKFRHSKGALCSLASTNECQF